LFISLGQVELDPAIFRPTHTAGDPPALNKKLMNFGPLTPEITQLMFTHFRLTVRILHVLVHLDHVTSLHGDVQSLKFFIESDLRCQVDSH